MATRVVTLGDGKRVTLAAYLRAVRLARAHPDHLFERSLEGWGMAYGSEIVRQFRAGIHDRINQRGGADPSGAGRAHYRAAT